MPAGTPVAANAALATAAAIAIRQDAAEQRAASVRAQRRQADGPEAAAPDAKDEAVAPTQRDGSDGSGRAAATRGAGPAGAEDDANDAAGEGDGGDAEGGKLEEQELYVHIPEDERQQLANDFFELMQVCCSVTVIVTRCYNTHNSSVCLCNDRERPPASLLRVRRLHDVLDMT